MQIRPLTLSDIDLLRDIDSSFSATRYLHLDQQGEGLSLAWKIEERPLAKPRVQASEMSEDTLFTARQLAAGHEEGIALVADYDGALLAFLLAQPDPAKSVLRLLDLRVDFDYRRQGMGTALGYMLIQHAKERELRAVAAESPTDNVPAAGFLQKVGFTLTGLDTHRNSNHDLVKERATLLWYATIDR